jgi:hypothetical protein
MAIARRAQIRPMLRQAGGRRMAETAGKVERVGLLVVHGIGQQQRFETAEALARSLGGTLAARDPAPRLHMIDRTGDRKPEELACPSADPGDSPYEIVVAGDGGRQTHIHVHEVWWADLGVSDSLFEQIRFWVWALGQWWACIERVTHFKDRASNTDLLMVGPKFEGQSTTEDYAPRVWMNWFRVLLFLWGLAAFLTFFSWNLVKQVMSWLSPFIGSSSLITDYVGHVRIYTQNQPPGGGGLEDVGQPWRATIRRRMIAEFVAMAERGYDRWYLLGHSQGSVLAFNAVQETEWCLPNYLEPEHASRLRAGPLWTHAPSKPDPAQPPRLDRMMPRRPVWLEKDEGVSRAALFQRFRGLVTYGSPLDKFATLWPRIVCINKQRDVFPDEAAWINLWDAADPIGASLKGFSDPAYASPGRGPLNIRVRANWLFLYAHICYFKAEDVKRRQETSALLEDVLPASGQPRGLREPFLGIAGHDDPQTLRHGFARFQAVTLGLGLALGGGALAYAAKGLLPTLDGSSVPGAAGPLRRALDDLVRLASIPYDVVDSGLRTIQGYLVGAAYGYGYADATAFVVTMALAVVVACGVYRRFAEKPLAPDAPGEGRWRQRAQGPK